MPGKYDIFQRRNTGEFVWIELQAAKTRMCQAARRMPGRYVVFDRQSVTVVADSILPEEVTRKTDTVL